MAIEKKEIEIAKETDDCMVLLIGIVKSIKAGKSAGEIAAQELPAFMEALNGANQIGEEAKSKDAMARTVGMRAGELAAAFIG